MGVNAQMLVKTKQPMTPETVRKLSGDLVEAFFKDAFSIWEADNRHALEIVNEFLQDGDDITPVPGEQLIEVYLSSRYYGEGYERGNFPIIKAVAEWLEFRIPGASIWYGGGSSGICAVPFDAAARQKLWKYFCANGHTPYTSYFGSFRDSQEVIRCAFCGNRPMIDVGGGGGDTFYRCTGCGKKAIVGGGKTQILDRNEDFFTARMRTKA